MDWFAQIQPDVGFDTYEISVPALPPAIVVNDPKNLEHVLKNNELFVKGDYFRSRSWDLFGTLARDMSSAVCIWHVKVYEVLSTRAHTAQMLIWIVCR